METTIPEEQSVTDSLRRDAARECPPWILAYARMDCRAMRRLAYRAAADRQRAGGLLTDVEQALIAEFSSAWGAP